MLITTNVLMHSKVKDMLNKNKILYYILTIIKYFQVISLKFVQNTNYNHLTN